MTEFEMKKKFGQNFLRDKNLLMAIVKDAGVTENDTVVEIGPGAGALTAEICQKAKKVYAYEIDKELAPILSEKLKEFNNVEIVFKDIMKVDIKNEDFEKESYLVVANLPYYITTPIIFKFLEEAKNRKSLTFMVQKEVAEKIVAKCKDSNYGVLSVMTNFYATTKIMRIVKRQMFFPQPKVDSAIIRLDIRDNNMGVDAIKFKKMVFACFNMRRKTILNNLGGYLQISKQEIENTLLQNGISPSLRAEDLDLCDFVKLCKLF